MIFLNKDKIEGSINKKEIRFDFFPFGKARWGNFSSVFFYFPSILISKSGLSVRFDSRLKFIYEPTQSPSGYDCSFYAKILGLGFGFEKHSSD